MTEAVRMEQITKGFGGKSVLDQVDLIVDEGQVVVLMGPSGAGKSTLLRCVNGLEDIESGTIVINGEKLTSKQKTLNRMRKHIGMLFQQFNLFPHMTVIKNITMAQCDVLGRSQEEAQQKAQDLLERVGLPDKANSYPLSLSGGEQQRVAIARSLAMDPFLMLFDEPTSALDPELVGEVLRVMKDLVNQGMTMLVVTHEMRFAKRAADRIVLMSNGNIVEQGSPDEVLRNPASKQGQAFLAEMEGDI